MSDETLILTITMIFMNRIKPYCNGLLFREQPKCATVFFFVSKRSFMAFPIPCATVHNASVYCSPFVIVCPLKCSLVVIFASFLSFAIFLVLLKLLEFLLMMYSPRPYFLDGCFYSVTTSVVVNTMRRGSLLFFLVVLTPLMC